MQISRHVHRRSIDKFLNFICHRGKFCDGHSGIKVRLDTAIIDSNPCFKGIIGWFDPLMPFFKGLYRKNSHLPQRAWRFLLELKVSWLS